MTSESHSQGATLPLNSPQEVLSATVAGTGDARLSGILAGAAPHGVAGRLRSYTSRLATSGRNLLLRPGGGWEWIVPIVISLVAWVWLVPTGSYLFAQDSLNFLNPFTTNNNPLAQFNPIFSWGSPIPDEIPQFYIQGINLGLSHIIPLIGLRQRVLAWLGAAAGCVGVWLLLRTILLANGFRSTQFLLLRSAATAFYLMNPLTLTLIWWHFEGWNLFYIFVPYLLWFLLETAYSSKLRFYPLALVTVVGIVLGPGLASGFAVSVTLGILAFAGATLGGILREGRATRDRLARLVMILGSGPLLIGWSIIPYVLVPHANLGSTSYVTSTNFQQVFTLQSSTTSLWNVSTLAATSWIYNVPTAFGTPDVTRWLFAPGVLGFTTFLAGAVVLPKWKGLGWLYGIALVSLFAAAGDNPPFGSLNSSLLSLGGAFLLLVNAYYFLIQYYVLLLTVLVLVIPVSLLSAATSSGTDTGTSLLAPASVQGDNRDQPNPTADRRSESPPHESRLPLGFPRWSRGPLAVAVAALVLTACLPFFVAPVFQSKGDNADSISLPSSFDDLKSTLESDGANSNFFTLVLPMSAQLGVPLTFPGGSGLLDTTDLISGFIPSYVLEANTGDLPSTLMNFLATCNPCSNLGTLFATLHIAWVVWNPYVDEKSRLVTLSPSGSPVNLPLLDQSLNSSLGSPQSAGSFSVYSVPHPIPILSVRSGLSVVQVQNATDYYSLLTSINSTPNSSLRSTIGSIWSAANLTSNGGVAETRAFAYRGIPLELPESGSGTALVINSSDAVSPLTDWGSYLSTGGDGIVDFSPPVANALANKSNVSTNMAEVGTTYESAPDTQTYLGLVNPELPWSTEDIEMTLGPATSHADWINIVLQNGSLEVVAQLYAASASGPFSFGLKASWNGSTFAWQSSVTPDFLTGQTVSIGFTVQPTRVSALLAFANTNVTSQLLLGSPALESTNQGYNAAAAPPGNSSLGSEFRVELQSIYPRTNVSAWQVTASAPVKFVVYPSATDEGQVLAANASETPSGDWTVNLDSQVPSGTYYVVLGFSASSLWSARGNGFDLTRLSVNLDTNVFQFVDTSNISEPRLSLVFNVDLDDGLYLSMAELVILPLIAAVPILRRR